jgi:hypothetical protein
VPYAVLPFCHGTCIVIHPVSLLACTTSSLIISPHFTFHIYSTLPRLRDSQINKNSNVHIFIMASQTETLVSSPSDLKTDSQSHAAVISGPASVPRNVRTEISYYAPPEDGGPQLPVYIKDENTRVTKQRNNFQPVTVYDVRGSGVEHTLDKTGIQYINHKITTKDFDDDAMIKESYYPEIVDLLYKV